MDDEPDDHSHHVHPQLPGHHLQVIDGDDLTADQTGDTEGRIPDRKKKILRFCLSNELTLLDITSGGSLNCK